MEGKTKDSLEGEHCGRPTAVGMTGHGSKDAHGPMVSLREEAAARVAVTGNHSADEANGPRRELGRRTASSQRFLFLYKLRL